MSQYFSDRLQQLQGEAETSRYSFRRRALKIFRDYGLPRRKQDPWKYVDNSALLNLPLGETKANVAAGDSGGQISSETAKIVCHTLNFENEMLCPPLAEIGKATRLLDMKENLDAVAAKWKLDEQSLLAEENSYSLINAFSFTCAYELDLNRLAPLTETQSQENLAITVCLRFAGLQKYQAPRLYVYVPAGCTVSLLLDSRELGPNVYWNPYFYVSLGENARLTLLERGPRLLGCVDTSSTSQHVRSVSLRGQVNAGCQVRGGLFYWGTALAIHDTRFEICGEAADVQMRSICFAEGRAKYHLRCENQHRAPNSESLCLYKNVLFDKAVSEFYGIIHADNNAAGTDANQSNQNLLLSNDARAIARPQLEILIDDLKCGHGSSTGTIAEEELFYMRARGLALAEAMRLAIVGFVEEVSTYFAPELLDALGIEDCLHALLEKRNK